MKEPPVVARTAYLQYTSSAGEGLQLEILAGDPDGGILPGHHEAVARIVADDDEFQWFEVFTSRGAIRIPVSAVEEAIAAARSDVHGEAWYDREQSED